MKTKFTILFAVIALGLLPMSVWSQPATVRYSTSQDQVFWVTNNTDKTLSVTILKVEVRMGSDWKNYSQPIESCAGTLEFHHGNGIFCFLTPHESTYGNSILKSMSLPKDGIWRARVIVQEQLTGQEKVDAAAKLRNSVKTTLVTNIPDDMIYWGHPVEIYSEVVGL